MQLTDHEKTMIRTALHTEMVKWSTKATRQILRQKYRDYEVSRDISNDYKTLAGKFK